MVSDALAPVSAVPHLELRLAYLRGDAKISLAEVLLEEAIENDEKIARSHFADLKLGHALLAVDPKIWHDRISVAAHDRLQRQLDGQIKMLREQWLDSGDYCPAVHLERIRDVVTGSPKQELNEPVAQPVQHQFRAGIVYDTPAADESRPEDAIVTLL